MSTNIIRRVRPSQNLVPPSRYAWIITKDHLFEQDPNGRENYRLTAGPSNAEHSMVQSMMLGGGESFQMQDAEGRVFFTGRIIGDYDGLEPLKDFGTPAAGATDIQFVAFCGCGNEIERGGLQCFGCGQQERRDRIADARESFREEALELAREEAY